MRCLLVLSILLIAFVGHVNAQFGFGPEVGLGMSSMHFAPPTYPIPYTSASVNPIFSGKVGGLIDLPLSKHVYLQAGLSVSRKGATRSFAYFHSDSSNESVHQTLDINYADLPVSVLYKSGVQGKGRFIAGLGATASYIIGGRNLLQDNLTFEGIQTNTTDNLKISVDNTLRGFDIGLNVNAGYELPTGLFFRAYYIVGVNDIATLAESEIDKNRMWGIAVGYFFGKDRNINKEASDLIDKTDLIEKSSQ